jgi:DNA repair and recombination protein RAD54 and RAD54-like protein
MEYFHLFNFVRPNVLGYSNAARFGREFANPITKGMTSNCSASVHYSSLDKANELNKILEPHVHRVDSSVLRSILPPMQQVVIHLRQTSMQSKLYRAYKRYQNKPGNVVNYSNFLKQFASLRPVHNHPVRLLHLYYKLCKVIFFRNSIISPLFIHFLGKPYLYGNRRRNSYENPFN